MVTPMREQPVVPAASPLALGPIVRLWWPLAASWLLMGAELPLVSAVIARLPEARLSLAAFGGMIMPVSLVIESPVVMLLAASTALVRDRASYAFLTRVMLALGGAFTALHVLVAFTPLYDLVAGALMGLPPEVREPGRMGLRALTPWTFAIAYRRTQQGVLIRGGRSSAVGWGTVVRLLADVAVLAGGLAIGTVPGSILGPLAMSCGVVAEAVSAAILVRPIARALPERDGRPLDLGTFARFYVPLALTPLLGFLGLPLASAAIGRMPVAIGSLAVTPVLNGLLLTARSFGLAFNEVVVALLERPGAVAALAAFARRLALATSLLLAAFAFTPLGGWWLGRVSALPRDLVGLGGVGLVLLLPMPALTVYQSWFQGSLVHDRSTRGVTEATAVMLASLVLLLGAGVVWQGVPGLFAASAAMTLANATLVVWLAVRARPVQRSLAGNARST
jgi:hypothetical protein